MALTEANKADIRFFLGWSARFHQADSRLEQAMLALENEPESETLVLAEITRCKLLDTRVTDAYDRLLARKVGSINLPGSSEIKELERQGRKAVGRIAATLGVEVRQDVFSPSKYTSFATRYGLTGGGNYGNYG